MKSLLIGLVALSFAAMVGSFLGALHPLGDSLAVFRRPMSAALIALGLLALRPCRQGSLLGSLLGSLRCSLRGGLLCLTAGALAMISTLHMPGRGGDGDLILYQKNLKFRMADTAPLLADIRTTAPDIITLQEVSTRLRPILTDLSKTHPAQAFCPFYDVVGGVAVLSRAPIGRVICLNGQGMVAAEILAPSGRYWAVSIHLHWPWPHRQASQIAQILPALQQLDGPVVIGGDFNMVPWGAGPRRIRNASHTKRTTSPLSSFPRFHPWVRLPIDQVMSPGGGKTSLRGLLGSDHHGLLARISL